MSPEEHYEEAERLLDAAAAQIQHQRGATAAAMAQAHATLALYVRPPVQERYPL